MLLCLIKIEYSGVSTTMHTGAEIKSSGDWERLGDNLETWSCGCTLIGSISSINVRCNNCGGVFKKIARKKAGTKKGKVENLKMELVNNTPALFTEPEIEEKVPCVRCDSSMEVKVFTQEWDRIKSHVAPCPMCCTQEWLDWSAGKRIMGEK